MSISDQPRQRLIGLTVLQVAGWLTAFVFLVAGTSTLLLVEPVDIGMGIIFLVFTMAATVLTLGLRLRKNSARLLELVSKIPQRD